MQFVHQPLTWGFLLVLVPVLIHLINMMRHRRVRWAAMDFLLAAYKKHRKWIWLKQLLLLLMRMAAIALIVAMLAQWITRGQWLGLFGGKATHHYVLLDDSYSMSDRGGGASAFDIGLQAIQRIGAQAADQDSPQKFTLIRFSRAARATSSGGTIEAEFDEITDFNAEVVDPNFDVTFEEKRNTLHVTEFSVGPLPALEVLHQLIDQSGDENRIIYLVSDFRMRDWDNPAEIRERLRKIEAAPARIQLVGCARTARPNLAVVGLEPANETQAAGVPLFVNVTVKNFGPEAARNVQLKVRTRFYDPDLESSVAPVDLAGRVDELPTVLIDQIDPGETATRRVQAFFPKPGRHVVEASLPDDPVEADNHRWCVIEFPAGEPVLIVDGSPAQQHAYFLQSAFQPGGRANTGVLPDTKTAAFLRDATPDVLASYRTIYLLDVPRLDDRAIENLEAFVQRGGGLAFFAGPDMDLAFYNHRLYRGGAGLFPLPLDRPDLLMPDDVENRPDIVVSEHPVFEVFLGERNPFIRLITIDQYVKPPADWKPAPDSAVRIAARLRNNMPLAVERTFGRGHVMAFLTTLAPEWNNWGNDPSFVVVALKLQSYLASARRKVESRLVGSPIRVELEAAKYRQDIQFTAPGQTPQTRVVIDRTAAPVEANSPIMVASIGTALSSGAGETGRSGIYEAWPVTMAGEPDVRRFALNVESAEGDLAVVDSKRLLNELDPIQAEFRYADQYDFEMAGLSGNNRSLLLMCLLIGLLLAEQILAYSASYHPARRTVR